MCRPYKCANSKIKTTTCLHVTAAIFTTKFKHVPDRTYIVIRLLETGKHITALVNIL